jgi:hypothetical protein
MSYTLEQVVAQLKDYNESKSNMGGLDYSVVNDLALAKQAIVAAFDGGDKVNAAVRDMIESKKLCEYKGYTIYYVPSAEELLNRLAAAAVYSKMIPSVSFEQHFRDASEVSQGTLDKWVPALGVGAEAKKAWNAVATKIKDTMLARKRESGSLPVAELFPVGEPVRVFTNTGVTSRPTPSYGVVTTGALPSVNALKFTWGMKGGSVSSHAPLYPAVVMNGGAHPFATFAGGDGAKAVKHIEASITAMENQFKLLTGKNLSDVTGAVSPSSVVSRVKTDVDDLEAALAKLRNANLALASAPLNAGVQPDYATLVSAGEEISKKAEKASRGWDRLSQIHEALSQLVTKQQMVKLSGGLHNALKH